MAGQDDDTERSEDPTQKRLDEALARGDVVKSQEVDSPSHSDVPAKWLSKLDKFYYPS
jgi:flagellar biosynthesis protein FlhB